MYEKPFWEISLNSKNPGNKMNDNTKGKRIYVNIATRSGIVTKGKPMPNLETNKTYNENNKLLCTINDRMIVNAPDTTFQNIKGSIALEEDKLKKLNTEMHSRLGHMSAKYMPEFEKKYPEIQNFNHSDFDEGLRECDVCFRAKMN